MIEHTLSSEAIVSNLVREDASFAEIVVQFVEGLQERITTMEKAMASSDYDSLRMAAHQLKGSGAGYGYPILTEKSAKLEQAAKDQNNEECRTLVDEIRKLNSRIKVGP